MSSKTNLVLDVAIFTAFLVATNPALTGIAIHEWLSIAFAAALITHLLFHWNWIVTLISTYLKKLLHISRLNFVVDSLLFIAMTAAMLTGILISRAILPLLGLEVAEAPGWRRLHSLSSDLSVILVALHFGLHWNWITSNVKRFILAPIGLAKNLHSAHHPANFPPNP